MIHILPWTFYSLEFVPYPSRHSFSVPLLITSHLLTLLGDPSVGWRYLWTPPLVTLFNLMVIYVIIGPNAMPSLECFPEHQFHVINFLLNIVSLMSGNISKLISPNRTYDLPYHCSKYSLLTVFHISETGKLFQLLR